MCRLLMELQFGLIVTAFAAAACDVAPIRPLDEIETPAQSTDRAPQRVSSNAIDEVPNEDPLLSTKQTPSQKATIKYFVVVALLFLVQIIMGIVVAHYGVEGNGFYGLPLAEWLPYSVARSWHTQL